MPQLTEAKLRHPQATINSCFVCLHNSIPSHVIFHQPKWQKAVQSRMFIFHSLNTKFKPSRSDENCGASAGSCDEHKKLLQTFFNYEIKRFVLRGSVFKLGIQERLNQKLASRESRFHVDGILSIHNLIKS